MAFTHGTKAKAYLGGYDLTGFLTSVAAPAERDMAETSTLSDSDKSYIPGLKGGSIALEGLFDGSAAAIDELLAAALAAVGGRVVTYLPAGDAFERRGRFLAAHDATYEVTTPVDGVAAVTAEFTATEGPDGGIVLHQLAARTGDGNGSDHDDGASSANGGVGYLQVTAYAGLDSADITVQHSTDGSAWVDLVTFTLVAAGPTSERIAVAGTVNRHLRAEWNLTGTGSITFHVGFARK